MAGEADSANADRLESFVDCMRRPGEVLVLDLEGLTFMDSSGLHALLRLNAAARERGEGLHLAAVRDVPGRVLQIAGVWFALNIHPSVEEAFAVALSFRDPPVREPQ
ncbi:STAS domain-containing protein [Nonomuraea turkmeniaca]|uniref:STAS domain-containing protein n=1 Tax=Nonomuraea turkmeniaca TaxID=103838 RepID=UPI00147760BA|nr:STAS domain-containing protein [Nonomuraea turkmeniaca]